MVQLLINSNVLFHPAAKSVELIIFPDQSEALLRFDSADCKQRGTKLMKALSESRRSLPQENPAVVSDRQLNNQEMKVLAKGLNFVTGHSWNGKLQFVASVETAIENIKDVSVEEKHQIR